MKTLKYINPQLIKYLSLFFILNYILLRLFLPGLTVSAGESSFLWIIAGIIFLLKIIDNFIDDYCFKNYNNKISYFHIIWIIWILWCLITLFWSTSKEKAIFQIFQWGSDLIIAFSLLYWYKKDTKILLFIYSFLLGLFIFELIYCIFQYFLFFPINNFYVTYNKSILKEIGINKDIKSYFLFKIWKRQLFGHFTISNSLGAYIILFFPIIIFNLIYFLKKKDKKNIIISIFLSLLSFTILLFTLSKGSLLSLLTSFIIILFIFYYYKDKYTSKIFILSILFLIFSILIFFLCTFTSLLDKLGKYLLSFLMRIGYWKAGFNIFLDNWIKGIGINNFSIYYYKYKLDWCEEVNLAHNCYLQLGIELGIIGIIFLIIFFIFYFKLFKFTIINTQLNYQNILLDNNKIISERDKRNFFILITGSLIFSFGILWNLGRLIDYTPLLIWFTKKLYLPNILGNIIIIFIIIFWAIIIYGFTIYFFKKLKEILSYKFLLFLYIGLTSFLIHTGIDIDLYVPNLFFNFILLLFLSIYIYQKKEENEIKIIIIPTFLKITLMLLLVFLIFYISFNKAPKLLQKDILIQKIKSLKREIEKKEKKINKINFSELKEIYYKYVNSIEIGYKLFPRDIRFYLYKLDIIYKKLQTFMFLLKKENNNNNKIYILKKIKYLFKEGEKYIKNIIKINNKLLISYMANINFLIYKSQILKKLTKENKLIINNYELILKHINRAIQLYPSYYKLLILKGEVLENLKRFKEAFISYKEALYIIDINNRIKKSYKNKIIKKMIKIINKIKYKIK